MVTRREFITGIVGVAVAPLLPTSVFATTSVAATPEIISTQSAALTLIVERIRSSFAHFVVCEETNYIPAQWGKFFQVYEDHEELRKMVQEDLGEVFSHPDFRKIKKVRGSILDEEGGMSVSLQMLLAHHFPVLPDRSDKELFEAYLTHAPKYLLE